MSNNITKKLELKAELLMHLDTARRMVDNGTSLFSSDGKVAMIENDLERLELGHDPLGHRLEYYRKKLQNN